MQLSEAVDKFELRSSHGLKAVGCKARSIAGITIRHLQHFWHPGRAWHELSGGEDTLTVVLAEIGGKCEARTNLRRPAVLNRQRPNHISFMPAEMPVWGYTDNISCVRELRLSFNRKFLEDCLGPDLDMDKARKPELMLSDRRAVNCARLLAAECDAAHPSADLYAEGLMIALLSACFNRQPHRENSMGLSAPQLRRVLDRIQGNLEASLSVAELARLAGLSSSQFGRLFRVSTGMSPHHYQLECRIGRAQELLLRQAQPLSSVALAIGFADQSHFTRVFKRFTGTTPMNWRRHRGMKVARSALND